MFKKFKNSKKEKKGKKKAVKKASDEQLPDRDASAELDFPLDETSPANLDPKAEKDTLTYDPAEETGSDPDDLPPELRMLAVPKFMLGTQNRSATFVVLNREKNEKTLSFRLQADIDPEWMRRQHRAREAQKLMEAERFENEAKLKPKLHSRIDYMKHNYLKGTKTVVLRPKTPAPSPKKPAVPSKAHPIPLTAISKVKSSGMTKGHEKGAIRKSLVPGKSQKILPQKIPGVSVNSFKVLKLQTAAKSIPNARPGQKGKATSSRPTSPIPGKAQKGKSTPSRPTSPSPRKGQKGKSTSSRPTSPNLRQPQKGKFGIGSPFKAQKGKSTPSRPTSPSPRQAQKGKMIRSRPTSPNPRQTQKGKPATSRLTSPGPRKAQGGKSTQSRPTSPSPWKTKAPVKTTKERTCFSRPTSPGGKGQVKGKPTKSANTSPSRIPSKSVAAQRKSKSVPVKPGARGLTTVISTKGSSASKLQQIPRSRVESTNVKGSKVTRGNKPVEVVVTSKMRK